MLSHQQRKFQEEAAIKQNKDIVHGANISVLKPAAVLTQPNQKAKLIPTASQANSQQKQNLNNVIRQVPIYNQISNMKPGMQLSGLHGGLITVDKFKN